MSTTPSTIEYIVDQLSSVPNIATRKMFGEYALYASGKVVGLVCDDTLYLKITEEGKAFVGSKYKEGIPYPGAKPWMKIDADTIDDHQFLSELVSITEEVLPMPKVKKKK